MKRFFLLSILFLANTLATNAQTTLTPGDITFVGIQADAPDAFAFVAMRAIAANTKIVFTDRSWGISSTNTNPNAFYGTGEDTLTWTAPANGINAGAVIKIRVNSPDTLSAIAYGGGTVIGRLNGISASGDNIFALQGSTANPTFIAGIMVPSTDTTWATANPALSTRSYLPSTLTNGTTAVAIGNSATVDNGYYNGIRIGTRTQLLAAINNKANWRVGTDTTAAGNQLWNANPFTIGTTSTSGLPTYNISQVSTESTTTGVADSLNVNCKLIGTVVGGNISTNGLQFSIFDNTGVIAAFKSANFTPPYVVTQGDRVRIIGKINQFRGLTQLNIDSMVVISSNNPLPLPVLVTTALGEAQESRLIRIDGLTLVAGQTWPAAGASATLNVSNGTITYSLRIDSDTDVDGSPAPAGVFSVIGIGGQFSALTTAPFLDGYQIIPRFATDIITIVGINEQKNEQTLVNIYPNPSNGMLNINPINQNDVYTLTLTNVAGQTIYTQTSTGNQQINLNDKLVNGLYFIKMEQNNAVSVQKLSIIR